MNFFRLLRHDPKLWWFIHKGLVGYIILAIGVGYAIHSSHNSAISEGLRTIHSANIQSCQRVNVLRAQSNLSDSVSFTILSISARREFALAHKDLPKTRQTHLKSAKLLSVQARKLNVTKLTNCNLAVNHPQAYRYPLAGPLGNPLNGKLYPQIREILQDSEHYVRNK